MHPADYEQLKAASKQIVTGQIADGGSIDPITITIPQALRISGLSRSELYRRLGDGSITAIKNGTRTLIWVTSLRDYLANLPPAQFRAGSKAA